MVCGYTDMNPNQQTPSPGGEGWGEGERSDSNLLDTIHTSLDSGLRRNDDMRIHTPSPLTGEGWGEGECPYCNCLAL